MVSNGQQFIFDYQDGKPGYNTSPDRGADTFRPFNNIESLIIFENGRYLSPKYTVVPNAGITINEDGNMSFSATGGLCVRGLDGIYSTLVFQFADIIIQSKML